MLNNMKKNKKNERTAKIVSISMKFVDRIVSRSSKIEGLSLARAKKNKAVRKLLQEHGKVLKV